MQHTLSYEGYSLVFEDNFDSPVLNRENWTVEQHEPGWVMQSYSAMWTLQRQFPLGMGICI